MGITTVTHLGGMVVVLANRNLTIQRCPICGEVLKLEPGLIHPMQTPSVFFTTGEPIRVRTIEKEDGSTTVEYLLVTSNGVPADSCCDLVEYSPQEAN